jgi:hypothetical protein
MLTVAACFTLSFNACIFRGRARFLISRGITRLALMWFKIHFVVIKLDNSKSFPERESESHASDLKNGWFDLVLLNVRLLLLDLLKRFIEVAQ